MLSSGVDFCSAALISVRLCVFFFYCTFLKAADAGFVPAIARTASFKSRSVVLVVCTHSSIIVLYLFGLCVTPLFLISPHDINF